MNSENVNVVELPQLHATPNPRATRLGHRLDLIEQMKVRVNVVVGSVEVPVSRLFALENNEILPLDQQVNDAVEVHLNGKVIARGILVAAGDQLGVRITEIKPE